MSEFMKLVERVSKGEHPTLIVTEMLGADRKDDIDSEEAKLAAFNQITGQIQGYKGYVGPDWITAIGEQLRSADPAGVAELADMAKRNRDSYVNTMNMDKGGSFQMWDNILRGILACRTEQVPPCH